MLFISAHAVALRTVAAHFTFGHLADAFVIRVKTEEIHRSAALQY